MSRRRAAGMRDRAAASLGTVSAHGGRRFASPTNFLFYKIKRGFRLGGGAGGRRPSAPRDRPCGLADPRRRQNMFKRSPECEAPHRLWQGESRFWIPKISGTDDRQNELRRNISKGALAGKPEQQG